MSACTHARFCGKRMAHGDREHGCSDVDEVQCDPTIGTRVETPTAPPGLDRLPYRRCSACSRTLTRNEWRLLGIPQECQCGSWSWVAVISAAAR